MSRLVLASASPRRKEILETLGLRFDVCPSDADEVAREGEAPAALVRRLAEEKAREVAGREHGWVLGADTVVVVDGEVLTKPSDDRVAASMLERLGGRWHEVVTGVAVIGEADSRATAIAVTTRVCFRALDRARVRRYVATGEGRDKAGAYAVQGLGSGLVSRIEGSYTNVVGLPAAETIDLLESSGALKGWP